MKISTRLLLLFLLVAVLPLALFSYFNLRQDEATLRTEALGRMSSLADKKAVQIKTYLAERVQDVRFLVRGPQVMGAIGVLSAEYAAGRRKAAKYAGENAATRQYFDRYTDETAVFYDVFLITPQGEIVYTQKHEADFATNLLTGPYRDTQLAQAFSNARMTLETVISGYGHYAPSSAPALFIAAPIMVDGKFKGVFAVQLGNELFYKVATDATGLGLSGEAVFAQLDGSGVLYTTPLKHQSDAALKFQVGRQEPKVPQMFVAVSGESGSGARTDYRGKPVMAAWRYLPELDWGMVVKIDADEVFAPIYRQRIVMLETVLGLLLFAGLAAYFFGRQISVPLKGLARAVGEMAMGNLDRRADERAPGELGLFAQAFNRMVEKLQGLYRTLEDRVEERTHELKEALNELRHQKFALDQHAIVSTADVRGTITYANEKFCEISGYSQQELLGQNHRLLNSGTHPKEFFRDMYRTIASGKVWQGDCCNRAKDGHLYWVSTTIVPFVGADGKPSQYISIRTDITKLKEHEQALELYKKVLDVTSDGFWMTDAQGNLLQANQAYADISGYTIGELTHMHILQLEAKEQSIDEVKAHIAKIIAQGSGRFETLHRRKDGRLIDIEITTSFLPETQQFAVFARDISERKLAQIKLQYKQRILNEAQRLGHLGSWELDLVSGGLRWSDEIYRIFELDPAQFSPSYESFLNVIHPDDRGKVNQAYMQSLQDRLPYDIVHRLQLADGRIKWVHERCTSDFDGSGKPLRSVGAVQDVTAQKLADERLRLAAATFETHEAIMITDADANILRVNRAFQEVTGYTPEEVLGKNPRMLSSGRLDKAFYAGMWQQLLHTGSWSGEMWDRRKSGQVYPKWLTITAVKNESGVTTEYVAMFSDISARKQAEDEIHNLAFYDALTRLPNRRLLLDRFRSALPVSARNGHYGAVLFLDLDRFKTLNDTLGHDHGDLLLIEVAGRIQSCVRQVDTVARLGGDEFVVLLEKVDEGAQEASQKVALIAEKIRATLTVPYRIKGSEYHSSSSIGVCLYCGNEESVDTLLKHADLAMYQAKESGRNTVRFFDPLMQQAVEAHAALEKDLRHALADRQLHLYYQIQVDSENRPLGAEALVRWIHPVRGMVSPAQFIPVAEESSLILEIGYWVLDTACRQLVAWKDNETTRCLSIAVNVSAEQFRLGDFVDKVAKAIRANHIDPSLLKLELTESVVLNDVADVVKKMHALKALGVKLSMDDFGTGYSSLSYFKRLPLDQLKIDQSFVRDIATDPDDAVMVATIIGMAQNFRLNVIAEGVETRVQLDFLKKNGCMAYQGYLFSKPVPIGEFEKLLGKV